MCGRLEGDGSCGRRVRTEQAEGLRSVEGDGFPRVRVGFTEKVMCEHRLEGGEEWPSGRRMFQAEGMAL